MPAHVIYTDEAAKNLEHIRAWLHQVGSGRHAKRVVERIDRALIDLARSAGTHAADPHHSGRLRMIVARHVIRYRYVSAPTGDFVIIERVYGPGQNLVEDLAQRMLAAA